MTTFQEQVPWFLKQVTLIFEGNVYGSLKEKEMYMGLWRICTFVFEGEENIHWSLQITTEIHWSGRGVVSQCKRKPPTPRILGLCSDICFICGTKETLPSTQFSQVAQSMELQLSISPESRYTVSWAHHFHGEGERAGELLLGFQPANSHSPESCQSTTWPVMTCFQRKTCLTPWRFCIALI